MAKFRTALLFLILALAAGTFAVGAQGITCEDEIGCVLIGPDDPVTLGWMLTISGSSATWGDDALGGIEIAIEQRDGMVLGREIELVGEDSLCQPEGGQTAAQKLVSIERVVAIIGPNCSSAAVPGMQIVSKAGYLMFSPTATSSALTNPDPETGGIWLPGFFRTSHNNLFQGSIAAHYLIEVLGLETLATVHDGSAYSNDLTLAIAASFAELGGEVIFEGAVNIGDTDMTAILTEIASNPPDVVFFPLFQPEGDFFLAQSKYVPGFDDTVMMSADSLLVPGFPVDSGEAALGVLLTGPAVSGEKYDRLLALWHERYASDPPNGFHAHAFDATNMLLDAIETVAQTDDNGDILIGRQALRDAVAAIENYDGVTGTLTCQATGDCATGEALAVFEVTEAEVNDGQWPPEILWQLSMSTTADGS